MFAGGNTTRTTPLISPNPTPKTDKTYLAKVHFIENNLVRMRDTPESRRKCEDSNHNQCQLIIPLALDLLLNNSDRIFCLLYSRLRSGFDIIITPLLLWLAFPQTRVTHCEYIVPIPYVSVFSVFN